MKKKIVYIVHVVDTEGPLFESLKSTFKRIEEIFGLKLKPTKNNLIKLQAEKLKIYNKKKIKRLLNPLKIITSNNWRKIDKMLSEITSTKYRLNTKDSFGNGWFYNWFCLNHVGFKGTNPRKRVLGYHKVYDHYNNNKFLTKYEKNNGSLQFHYHAPSLTSDAHRAGSTFLNSSNLFDCLSRFVIDRNWFPSVFRAGHNCERLDLNFFLEQWIPFDFSNNNYEKNQSSEDLNSRFDDWRNASKSWLPYHPDHRNYQRKGNCHRLIARCVPINERSHTITYSEITKAFQEAQKKGNAILSFFHHDFRDMRPDLEYVKKKIMEVKKKFPKIKFKYSSALEAMRNVNNIKVKKKIGFKIKLKKNMKFPKIFIEADNDLFGPQPFFCLKTKKQKYHWQNLDFEGKNKWSYSFDNNNIFLSEVDKIGIASNDSRGLVEVVNIKVNPYSIKRKIINK